MNYPYPSAQLFSVFAELIQQGIMPRAKMTVSIKSSLTTLLVCLTLLLTGCENLGILKKEEAPAPPPPPAPAKSALPSAAPIFASKSDIFFAQTALKSLGFRVGPVDGLWGPRSANAVKLFEQKYRIRSANGRLSELNLLVMEKLSHLARESFVKPKTNEKGIAAQLRKTAPLSSGPQLIIVDRSYDIMSKANPFSEVLVKAPKGSGIYIFSLVEGWYKVESTDGHAGYIKSP